MRRHEMTRWAMRGRLRVGKAFFTSAAALVGAAMCSASHDGVSVKGRCGQTMIQGGALISAGFPANLTSGGS